MSEISSKLEAGVADRENFVPEMGDADFTEAPAVGDCRDDDRRRCERREKAEALRHCPSPCRRPSPARTIDRSIRWRISRFVVAETHVVADCRAL